MSLYDTQNRFLKQFVPDASIFWNRSKRFDTYVSLEFYRSPHTGSIVIEDFEENLMYGAGNRFFKNHIYSTTGTGANYNEARIRAIRDARNHFAKEVERTMTPRALHNRAVQFALNTVFLQLPIYVALEIFDWCLFYEQIAFVFTKDEIASKSPQVKLASLQRICAPDFDGFLLKKNDEYLVSTYFKRQRWPLNYTLNVCDRFNYLLAALGLSQSTIDEIRRCGGMRKSKGWKTLLIALPRGMLFRDFIAVLQRDFPQIYTVLGRRIKPTLENSF